MGVHCGARTIAPSTDSWMVACDMCGYLGSCEYATKVLLRRKLFLHSGEVMVNRWNSGARYSMECLIVQGLMVDG